MNPRLSQRLIEWQTKIDPPHEDLQYLRDDRRAASRASRQHRLAVFQHDRGAHARQRTLKRGNRVRLRANQLKGIRLTWRDREIIHLVVQHHARARHDHFAAVGGVDCLRHRDPIAVGVGRGDMIGALKDPYSDYLTPESLAAMEKQISSAIVGIGVQLELVDKQIRVVTPLAGSPALKAGVRSGDAVLEIDGQSTTGLGLPDVVKRIAGPAGTSVRLKISREDSKTLDLSIAREVTDQTGIDLPDQFDRERVDLTGPIVRGRAT